MHLLPYEMSYIVCRPVVSRNVTMFICTQKKICFALKLMCQTAVMLEIPSGLQNWGSEILILSEHGNGCTIFNKYS